MLRTPIHGSRKRGRIWGRFEDEGILKPFGDKRFQGEVLFHSSFITEQTKYVYFRGIMFSINFAYGLFLVDDQDASNPSSFPPYNCLYTSLRPFFGTKILKIIKNQKKDQFEFCKRCASCTNASITHSRASKTSKTLRVFWIILKIHGIVDCIR